MQLVTLEDVVQSLLSNYWAIAKGELFIIGEIYCAKCGGNRRTHAKALLCDDTVLRPAGLPLPPDLQAQMGPPKPTEPSIVRALAPSLFELTCGQCDSEFTLVIYVGDNGPRLAIFPSVEGGLSTPNTPNGVRYYLDQAARAHGVGANSAAIAMFRAALDFLLFEQNYRVRMLGPKLLKLEADIAAKTAPKWALELDTEFLTVIKDLGNSSIHPNADDISNQSAIDTVLYVRVAQTFQELLDLIYEVPVRKAERLSDLRSKSAALKK